MTQHALFDCHRILPHKVWEFFIAPDTTQAISVKKSAEIAAAFQKDGVRGQSIREFAKRSAERDMFRWCLALRVRSCMVWTFVCVALSHFKLNSNMWHHMAQDQATHSPLHCQDPWLEHVPLVCMVCLCVCTPVLGSLPFEL